MRLRYGVPSWQGRERGVCDARRLTLCWRHEHETRALGKKGERDVLRLGLKLLVPSRSEGGSSQRTDENRISVAAAASFDNDEDQYQEGDDCGNDYGDGDADDDGKDDDDDYDDVEDTAAAVIDDDDDA